MTITASGVLKATHDRPHQAPPSPNSADNKPNSVTAARTRGHRHTVLGLIGLGLDLCRVPLGR